MEVVQRGGTDSSISQATNLQGQISGSGSSDCSVEDLILEAVKGYRKAQGLDIDHIPKAS